jgi:hypothetical protein
MNWITTGHDHHKGHQGHKGTILVVSFFMRSVVFVPFVVRR